MIHPASALLSFAIPMFSLHPAATTQQLPGILQSLSIGAPIERELPGGQTHIYRIAVGAGQFALVQVEQRGAEVVLTANGPDGKEFALVDLRIGGKGVELLAIVADAAGEYFVKVISRDSKARAGRYEVKLSELRAATVQDHARARAQALSYQARTVNLEQTPETKRKAAGLYMEALLLWQQVPEPLWEAALLWRLGRLHIELTEFRQAKDFFSRSAIARRAVGDRRGELSAENGVCEALHYLGDMKGKAACLDALVPIYRELGERLEEAKVQSNIATTFRDLGEYQAALQSAEQALRVFQMEEDRVQQSFALNTLGEIYWSLNEHQMALDHFERALAIRREGTDKRRVGLTLGDIGSIYFELGDYPRALEFFNQSLAIIEEVGDRRTKAIRLRDLGELWKRTGETAKALEAQRQSLALVREVGDRYSEGRTLIAMADLYLLMGEREKARDALTEALEIARAAGDPVGEASALKKVGRLAAAAGDWRQALELLQQSLSLAGATGDLQGERDALVDLAKTERERDNLIAARDYHERALALTESLRTKILHHELRASYLASRQDEYELYVDPLMQLHEQQPNAGYAAAAFEISERGRARSMTGNARRSASRHPAGVDAGLLGEERKLTGRIREKEQQRTKLIGNPQGAKHRDALANEIRVLLNEYQSLQGRIRAVSPRYAALTQPQPVTLADIQKRHLDRDTVLLEFALGESRSWLWAITPDAIMRLRAPAPRRD